MHLTREESLIPQGCYILAQPVHIIRIIHYISICYHPEQKRLCFRGCLSFRLLKNYERILKKFVEMQRVAHEPKKLDLVTTWITIRTVGFFLQKMHIAAALSQLY